MQQSQATTALKTVTPVHPSETKGGYYTVTLDLEGQKIPYTVYAVSDYQAARIVKQEMGIMVREQDVEGPFQRF